MKNYSPLQEFIKLEQGMIDKVSRLYKFPSFLNSGGHRHGSDWYQVTLTATTSSCRAAPDSSWLFLITKKVVHIALECIKEISYRVVGLSLYLLVVSQPFRERRALCQPGYLIYLCTKLPLSSEPRLSSLPRPTPG